VVTEQLGVAFDRTLADFALLLVARETVEQKLARYEFVLDAYVRELTTLREENERLRSVAGAHEVLKSIYADSTQPTGHRIKAAGLALGHESAPLKPTEAPLELVAEVIEPLSVVVERQRMRARAIQALPLAERERMIAGVVRRDGNGSDDSSRND
jgi:hypothetical protein